jgi:uroporphyrinogen decarboxylase
VERLSEIIWGYNERLFKNAAEAGADVLLTGDDYAGRLGTLMSPAHFRRFVLPYLKRAVEVAKSFGLPFIKHTDGNLWKVMDDIVGSGISGLCPLEPIAHMDIGEVKRRYGDRICLAGNIDCTEVLPHGTEKDVAEAVKETIAKAAPGGGFVLSSSNSIHPGVKPDNYLAMINAARKFGNYPLDKELLQEYRNKNYMERFLD